MSVPAEDGSYQDIPEDVYHADRGSLSVSGAKLLLPPSCPAKFREQQDNPPPPSKVFDFGHLAHSLILGKGQPVEVLDPAVHGLKADGTAADVPSMTGMWKKAAAAARTAGKLPVSADDYMAALAMRESVVTHPIAGQLFTDGTAEVSMYHTDIEGDVRLRGRVDWLRNDGNIVDLKTAKTSNPAELVTNFWRYGYVMQAAWYRRLVINNNIHADPTFTFVVVEKVPPFVVSVVRYDTEAITEGERLNRLAINTYADCMASGVWPGYTDQTVTISVPPWAFPKPESLGDFIADSYIYEIDPLAEEYQ